MANLAPRFADMTANVKAQVKHAFRNWPFVAPANLGAGRVGPQPIAAPGNWLPIPSANTVMATGAEGVVHLWCDVDINTQRIHDRVVVKHVVSGQARYQDRDNWVNNQVGGQPLECRQANLVWAAIPAVQQHIQSCLGWGDVVPPNVVPQTYQYKLYHEYCSQSSMNRVMKNQTRKKKKPGAKRRIRRQLPEPFLWYMFESLAKACVAMDNAYSPRGLVHQDMHPGNIFFGDPDPTRFATYPVLKVADFGSSREITTQVRNRGPIVQNDPVCLNYAAPENSWNTPIPMHGPFPWEARNMVISKKTNIYQVGLIMASAIRLIQPLPENDWRQPPHNYRVPPANQLHHDQGPTIGVSELSRDQLNPGPKKYSVALINLVMQCLRHNSGHRPFAHRLLQRIRLHANFQGMDQITAPIGPLTAAEKDLCIEMIPDRYAVGKIF
ncbi:hypothetical protein KCU65_g3906, partial [Aureobasidium melanogenum]